MYTCFLALFKLTKSLFVRMIITCRQGNSSSICKHVTPMKNYKLKEFFFCSFHTNHPSGGSLWLDGVHTKVCLTFVLNSWELGNKNDWYSIQSKIANGIIYFTIIKRMLDFLKKLLCELLNWAKLPGGFSCFWDFCSLRFSVWIFLMMEKIEFLQLPVLPE